MASFSLKIQVVADITLVSAAQNDTEVGCGRFQAVGQFLWLQSIDFKEEFRNRRNIVAFLHEVEEFLGSRVRVAEGFTAEFLAALGEGSMSNSVKAAGIIYQAEDTGRFLLAHRSPFVDAPLTWGSWGGKLKVGETPEAGALREAKEESGYSGEVRLKFLHKGTKGSEEYGTVEYTTFMGIVPREFEPHLNWETSGFRWVTLDSLPYPLHPGLKESLDHLKPEALLRSKYKIEVD